jgi:signal transduction histidine kinase
VSAPLAAGYLWLWCHQAQVERDEAHRVADRVEDLVREGRTAEVGALLVEHPHVGVVVGGRAYGRALPRATAGPLVDIDGNAEPELVLRRGPHATVGVYLSRPRSLPVTLLVFSGACALLFAAAGIATWGLLVRRDVRRATVQVAAVAGGAAPPRWEGPGLATAELRQLVGAVGRLVHRITETNVAKYVSIEKAKEADRLKSQFLANMSHDLRSPLNSILGFSELLTTGIDGPLAEEDRQLVQLIHASGRELLQQIDDILDTAKMEAGRMELHPEPTPPATLISRAIQNARQRQHGTIDFETTVAPGLPAAFVDPYRTVQALENVLVFASERMAGGTVSIALRQAFGERGRMVTVEVRTAVPPATADQLRRARHGFHRIPGHAGLGLGLPLATSILEVQGGNLEIEDLGVDMLFCARLPAPESRRAARLRADAS